MTMMLTMMEKVMMMGGLWLDEGRIGLFRLVAQSIEADIKRRSREARFIVKFGAKP